MSLSVQKWMNNGATAGQNPVSAGLLQDKQIVGGNRFW